MSTPRNHRRAARRTLAAAVMVMLVLVQLVLVTGCGPKREPVCQGRPEHFVLLPSTSQSDIETDQQVAADVAHQVVRRAANSCGRISVGLQNNRTEADLELRSMKLVPKRRRAFNRRPTIRKMIKDGLQFVDHKLLKPLARVPITKGSPFLGADAKVGAELVAHGLGPATVIQIGDGIDIEAAPSGRGMIDFRRPSVRQRLLHEFVPLLAGLKGSCVMLVAAGADSTLPAERIRASRRMLKETLSTAGVGFVATRSRDLPRSCGTGRDEEWSAHG